MNKLERASYTKIFPENLKKYKNLTAFSKSIEKIFKTYIVDKIETLALFYNLEVQEDNVLDEIAWFFNIDKYRVDLDREIKIKLIKSAYWVHSKKGTKTAVISQLKNLNYEIKIEEWFGKRVNAGEDIDVKKNLFLGAYKQIRKEIVK